MRRKNSMASSFDLQSPTRTNTVPMPPKERAVLVNPWACAALLIVAVGLMAPTAEFVSSYPNACTQSTVVLIISSLARFQHRRRSRIQRHPDRVGLPILHLQTVLMHLEPSDGSVSSCFPSSPFLETVSSRLETSPGTRTSTFVVPFVDGTLSSFLQPLTPTRPTKT